MDLKLAIIDTLLEPDLLPVDPPQISATSE
jgi:hypothetical protein